MKLHSFLCFLLIIQRRYFLKKNMNKMAAYTFIINKFYSRTTILKVHDLTILFYYKYTFLLILILSNVVHLLKLIIF